MDTKELEKHYWLKVNDRTYIVTERTTLTDVTVEFGDVK